MNFKEGKLMKNAEKVKSLAFCRGSQTRLVGFWVRILTLVFVLCALVSLPGGCGSWAQPGETKAEGHRRHLRNLSVNQQEMMADIDKVLLFDKPSKLTDKRIP